MSFHSNTLQRCALTANHTIYMAFHTSLKQWRSLLCLNILYHRPALQIKELNTHSSMAYFFFQGKSCSFLSKPEVHSFSRCFRSAVLKYTLERQSSAKELLTSTVQLLALSANPSKKTVSWGFVRKTDRSLFTDPLASFYYLFLLLIYPTVEVW